MDNIPLGCFFLGVFLTVIIGLPIMLKFALHQFEEGIEFGMKVAKAKEQKDEIDSVLKKMKPYYD